MHIAIISPSKNAYSETFIRAHKNFLMGKIFFYHGNRNNLQLEGFGELQQSRKRFFLKLIRKVCNKPYSWYYDRFLIESFEKSKIDVVLAEYGTTANEYLKVIKEANLPLVVHFHGYDASRKHVIKQNHFYKDVFKYSRYVIAVSKRMVNDLKELGCPEKKIVYNPYGPHNNFLKIKPQFSRNRFIAVGRFVDKKAPYYTILAFHKVIEKKPEAQLIMAGDGPLLSMCKNLTRVLGMEKNVLFPGIITPEEFRAYLSTSLAFVQHSITAEDGDSEGTPVAILEASAAGLPVISSKHAGIPDIILDGKTGLLTEEHDIDGMSYNMVQIIEDRKRAEEMGRAGKKYIKENFPLKKHIDLLNELMTKSIR